MLLSMVFWHLLKVKPSFKLSKAKAEMEVKDKIKTILYLSKVWFSKLK